MAQAYWQTDDYVMWSGSVPGARLFLQKGQYKFFDPDSRPQGGIRFIWEVNGKLQARPARLDDLAVVDELLAKARAKGW